MMSTDLFINFSIELTSANEIIELLISRQLVLLRKNDMRIF